MSRTRRLQTAGIALAVLCLCIDAASAAEDGRTTLSVQVQARDTDRVRLQAIPIVTRQIQAYCRAWVDSNAIGEGQITGAGRVAIEVPTGAHVAVLASGPEDPIARALTYVGVVDAGRTAPVEVVFPATPPLLHGVVVDRETSQPVTDASIQAIDDESPGLDCVKARSRADGTFELRVPPNQVRANVRAAGYAEEPLSLSDDPSDPSRRLVVAISRGATLEVRARDLRGLPMPSLSVRAHLDAPVRDAPHEWSATTDAQGVAEIAHLPASKSLRIAVYRGAGILRVESSALKLEPGERRQIELRIAPGARVQGRVIDQQREPVAGARIRISAVSEDLLGVDSQPFSETIADSNGAFAFEEIAPGRWRVATVWPQQGSGQPPRVEREIQIADGVPEVAVTLETFRGLSIAGRVVGSDGRPRPRVSVLASSEGRQADATSSDADGRFVLESLWPAEFELRTVGPRSPEVRARPGDTEVILRPVPAGGLSGIVVDRDTSRPVQAMLAATCSDAHIVQPTSERGRFLMPDIEAGACRIRARTQTGSIGFLHDVVVRADQVVENLEIQVVASATLEIVSPSEGFFRVADAQGHELCTMSVIDGEVARAHDSGGCLVPPGKVVVQRGTPVLPTDGSRLVTEHTYTDEATVTLRKGERRRLSLAR